MFIVYNDFYCRSLSYRVELVSKKSSKYCEHMNEEDFDIEDEEEGQNSEDVEMKRVKDVAIVPGLVMRSGGLTEEIWEWLIDQSSSGYCCPEDSSLVWD